MAKLNKVKLNIKALGAQPMACWADGGPDKTGHEIAVARFYGVATGLKAVASAFSDEPENALLGSFDGVNLLTGETITGAGKLFLPDVARAYVESKLLSGMGAVKFDITISAERSVKKDGSLSFMYSAEVHDDDGESAPDPVADMRARIQQQLAGPGEAKQIAGPVKKKKAA